MNVFIDLNQITLFLVKEEFHINLQIFKLLSKLT